MKVPFPVSLDETTIEWISKRLEKGYYRNKSHLVEEALKNFKKKIESGKMPRYF